MNRKTPAVPTWIPPILWHYTVGCHLEAILSSRVLRASTAHLARPQERAVWFSARQDWEPTANKGWSEHGTYRGLTRQETMEKSGGLVRIGVRPTTAPYGWADYVRLSGINRKMAAGLRKAGVRAGSNPYDWFVSFMPVPMEKWVAVETYNPISNEWQPHKSKIDRLIKIVSSLQDAIK
jgi:hypothetical protein